MTRDDARAFIIQHINRRGTEPVVVTTALCKYWWRILNIAVFNDSLHMVREVEVSRTRGVYAWISGIDESQRYTKMKIQEQFPSRFLFLNVLVHEMVHAWEFHHHRTMGHGKRFHGWQDKIWKYVHLDLQVSFNQKDYEYGTKQR